MNLAKEFEHAERFLNKYSKKGVCDVCRLLDEDTEKKEGEYCKVCKAFICNKDKLNLVRRGKAALIKLKNKKP